MSFESSFEFKTWALTPLNVTLIRIQLGTFGSCLSYTHTYFEQGPSSTADCSFFFPLLIATSTVNKYMTACNQTKLQDALCLP